MKNYIIEENEKGFWTYLRMYSCLEDCYLFCTIMKQKHPKIRYRIIEVWGNF